ncbi:HlyD family secretion protein [Prochlorococcus marinus]|uniref:HlyD family secretion protein n=1 Tax=Prochlorococcus TaxID=1218 RepID=UPI0007B36F8A|nr:HlyD family efflux transporter periplasmic adaptor subunit [Prochlorococcus marinus]KZR74157.1 Hemolysin secretion protein D, chromosomal [Prochlorococcus marinus str. MIT 1323]
MNIFDFFSPKKSQLEKPPPVDLGLLPPPPIWSRVLIWTLGSGTIALLLWSIFTRVEEIVMLQGELTTARPAVKVSTIDHGVISSILTRPHQSVASGDPLIVYGDDETKLRLESLTRRLNLLSLKKIKEDKMYDLRIRQKEEQLQLDKILLKQLTYLANLGAVQKNQVLEKQAQVAQIKIAILSLQEEKERSNHQAEQSIEEMQSTINILKVKSRRFIIKAPVDGFIQDVKYQTPGERIQPGDVVATIIPDRELIAKVKIPSKISAPVEVNSKANLDIDAYPTAEFGGIEAKVLSLSPMTQGDNNNSALKIYTADLQLIKPKEPDLLNFGQLRPGMSVTARLRLRDKAVITTVFDVLSGLFDPLTQQR